jgi:cell wall-associated NlpC family hydrolase
LPSTAHARHFRVIAGVAGLIALSCTPLLGTASAATGHHHHVSRAAASHAAAKQDAASLVQAAAAVENEALDSRALSDPLPSNTPPAKTLLLSVDALLTKAQKADPSGTPTDTRAVMGAEPYNLAHRPAKHPKHHRVTLTHVFASVTGALLDNGSKGWGLHRKHDGAWPALLQHADGKYVDPTLPALSTPTVAMTAVRSALQELGQPYVWAGAGPSVFDCSGLVQWAYAQAGIRLGHYTGLEWNEGALISPRDILPGDLILFEYKVHHHEYIHHVGIYLGAGWMVNAPYTGQYVNVVPVESGVAGVIRP